MISVTSRDFLPLYLKTPLVSRNVQTTRRHFIDMFMALSKVSPHLTTEQEDCILVDYEKLHLVLIQTCWFDYYNAAETIERVAGTMSFENKVYTVYYIPPGATNKN